MVWIGSRWTAPVRCHSDPTIIMTTSISKERTMKRHLVVIPLASLLLAATTVYVKVMDVTITAATTFQNTPTTQDDHHHHHDHRHLKNREGVASYMQICQAVVAQSMFPGELRYTEVIEDMGVCRDETRTTTSLSRIFISSYLAYQAQVAGFKIGYTHNCDVDRAAGVIQELLPPQITIQPELVAPIDMQGMVILCERLDNELKFDLLRLVVPVFRDTFSTIVTSVLTQIGHGGNSPRHGILNVKKDRNGDPETAVIFLPCSDKQCSDVWVFPLYSFLQYIPASVRVVDIVMTPACDAAMDTCRQYVIDLADSLEQFDPTRTVQIMIANPLSIELMSRLMVADHVLCGAGWGKQCLIPALARPPQEQGRFVVWEGRQVDSNDKEQSTEAMLFEAVLLKIGDPDAIARVTSPAKLIPTRSLAELSAQPGLINDFFRTPPPPGSGVCRFLRGKLGHWVQDFDYARQAQYRVPLLHHSGAAEALFRESARDNRPLEQQFRPATTYKWQETLYSGGCDVPVMTKDSMCSLLNEMGILRLFFLGDSLTMQHALSLWMLLGPEEDLLLPDQSAARYVIECGNVPGFSFVLQFVRNDELIMNDEPVSMPLHIMNCKNYCYPWMEPYLADNIRTLAIANTGAHLNDRDLFENGILRFVETFDSLKRVNDIVLFRTLVPGHKNCGRPGLKPYESFAEYIADEKNQGPKDTYNWGVFSSNNDFVSRFLDERAQQPQVQARMEVLEVFPMTVLRPDGHMADEFKSPQTKRTDCLHYSLPGPIDWWNHLMMANLMDIHLVDDGDRATTSPN